MKKLIIATFTAMIALTSIAQTTTDFDARDIIMEKKEQGLVFQVIVKFTNPTHHKQFKRVPEYEKELTGEETNWEMFKREEYQRHRYYNEMWSSQFFERLNEDLGVEIKHLRSMSLGNDLLEITTQKSLDETMEALSAHYEISKAALNGAVKVKKSFTMSANGATWDGNYYNDPLYSTQNYFGSQEENAANGNFEAFKQNLENNLGRKLRIGIADSGSSNHEDLSDSGGYSFITSDTFESGFVDLERKADYIDNNIDPSTGINYVNGHGTAVASTIAAHTDNGLGMTGLLNSEDLEIFHAKVCGNIGCPDSDTIDAIVWLSGGEVAGVPDIDSPVDIINLSLGGYNPAGCTGFYQEAMDFAIEQGVVVVVAAGNDNTNASGVSPAGCKGTITVASLDNLKGDRSDFSNYGNATVDVAVAGSNITALKPDMTDANNLSSDYHVVSGTSFAAPLVSAVVGGLKMKYPDLTPIQIERILEANSNKIDADINGIVSECLELGCGAGSTDAYAALKSIENLFTVNRSQVNHVYEGNTDTRYLDGMNNIVPICELYKSQFGSIGAPFDGIEYNVYTYSGTGDITEANATLINTVNDPVVVINSPDRLAYQACQNGSCGEVFEMEKDTSKPAYCN